ncbi:MAG TPA: DUF2911 domain-containing protein [Vicinamibacterales bacterium]|nr:DUF2911 domain-containing protein [Vicinamibacterales bacterium]
MRRLSAFAAIAIVMAGAVTLAQTPAPARSPSPDGIASMQAGVWKADDAPAARVSTGKWIDILYGRPLRRGRTTLFGSGASYGAALKGGAAVWRAGANVLTRLRTEAKLVMGGKTIPPGEYTLFIDLAGPSSWTLIVSSQPANAADDVPTRSRNWEAFVYAPEKDVARAPMKIETLPYIVEQLTYEFTDVTGTNATLRLKWDTVMASVAFGITP